MDNNPEEEIEMDSKHMKTSVLQVIQKNAN